VTDDRSSRRSDPHGADTERMLAGLRFEPRASLGPEIRGRVRRGEVARGGLGPRRRAAWRWLAAAALLVVAIPAGLTLRQFATPGTRVDHCCSDLDGGSGADDGYVVQARGRRIESVTVYEDADGNGRLSPGDRVRLARGDRPIVAPDSVLNSIRVCCVDLDGEGAADDGLLVLNGADERVVLAGIFEQGRRSPTPVLR
jgi:hypothetical protein